MSKHTAALLCLHARHWRLLESPHWSHAALAGCQTPTAAPDERSGGSPGAPTAAWASGSGLREHQQHARPTSRPPDAWAALTRARGAAAPFTMQSRCLSHVPPEQQPAASAVPTLHWPPKPVHWIERIVPHSLLPYVHVARLHKPVGTWLLAWPCFWSIAQAAPPGTVPDLYTMALFGTGALVRLFRYWKLQLPAGMSHLAASPLATRAGLVLRRRVQC